MNRPESPATTSQLSAEASDALLDWGVEFDRSWTPVLLDRYVAALPETLQSCRKAAIEELVQTDIVRQWEQHAEVLLESYLQRFPDLGTAETVSPELIAAEVEARLLAGQRIDEAQLEQRFPHQAAAVLEQLSQSGSDIDERSTQREPAHDAVTRTILRADEDSVAGTGGGNGRDVAAAETLAGHSQRTAIESPLQPGQRFGPDERFEIVRDLGHGGMASVFLANNLVLRREVAIKVPRRSVLERPELVDRFRQEARSLARVKHQNLASIYDTGETDGLPYVVMEFVSGVTLAEYLKDQTLTVAESVEIVRDVALALQAAHEADIIHRDLKPENVMLTQNLKPKVIDFGLAKNTDRDGERPTRVGTVMGTPHYMPLEQLRGETDAIGPASDVYSLGVVLYRLLTGRLPYPGHEFEELLANILTRTPSSPCEIQPDLDPKLAAIVLKAIARDRENRYLWVQDFAAALADWLRFSTEGGTPAARLTDARSSGSGGVRRKAAIAAAGAVCILLLGLIVISLKRPDGTQSTITISPGTNLKLHTEPGTEVSITELPDADGKGAGSSDTTAGDASETAPVVDKTGDVTDSESGSKSFETLIRSGVLAVARSRTYVDPTSGPGWISENGVFQTTAPGDKLLMFEHRDFENFQLTAEYKVSGPHGAAFVARCAWREDRPKGYSVGLGPSDWEVNQAGSIYHWQYKSANIHPLCPRPALAGPVENEWVQLDVTVQGNRVTAKINGQLFSEAADPNADYPTSKVAFSCSPDSTLSLRNVRVHALPDSSRKLPGNPEPVVTGDPAAIQKLKDTLLSYEWNYFGSKHPPGGPFQFYADGTFQSWKWNYWAVGLRTVHIQYWDPVYKPESAIVFSVNEDLSELKGSFGEGKNQITITRLKPLKPEVAEDSSELRLFNGDWKIEDGELVLSSKRTSYGHWWTFGEPDWSDFDLKVEMSYHELCPSCALIVRHTAMNSSWHVRLGPWAPKNFDLVCFAPREDPWKNPTRRYMAGRLRGEPDVWQTVAVQARGQEISVSIDGEFITRSQHPGVLKGLIGFHTYGPGTVRWRNLEVRSPDGKLLRDGFPELPGAE